MKEDLKQVAIIVGCIMVFLLLTVSFGYFLSWIFTDPFKIIPDAEPYVNKVWEEQSIICKNKGGIPIQSGWNGQIKECRF